MALQRERLYTYQEWQKLDLGERRAELINGRIYMMASVSPRHQAILGEMHRQLSNHLRGKRCKPFITLDVQLENDTILIPDLIVICDPKKITKSGCSGSPDLVVEILSPSTSRHDRFTKLMLYQHAGVPEYWIVDPVDNTLTTHRLTEKGYTVSVYGDTDTATVNALPDFVMDLSMIFIEEENEA